MARETQTIVTILDDFDSKPIDENLVQTIDFSVEGTDYRMELRPENAEKFRKDLEKWTAAAPQVKGKRGRPRGAGSSSTRAPSGSGLPKETLAQIREWSAKNGRELSSRGRVPVEVIEAWEAEHKSAKKPANTQVAQ